MDVTYNRGTVTELTTQNDIGIVNDCLSQCSNQGASCLSVILNNERGGRQSCSAVTSSAVADQTDPTSATGVSYFEKICLSKSRSAICSVVVGVGKLCKVIIVFPVNTRT